MKTYLGENYLLENDVAIKLYHQYAKEMPIYDYHCHLDAKEIWEDKKYNNITELWLSGDHYKWRGMRSNGIRENEITGHATEREKFNAWTRTIPYCIGNPLYNWSHLEMRRYFNIEELINVDNSEYIWNRCNELLKGDDYSARGLIKRSNVKLICTTDDPIDSLEYHKNIKNDDTFDVVVLPTFRPDKGLYIEQDGFVHWIIELEKASGIKVAGVKELMEALKIRAKYFDEIGCKISDHSLSSFEYIGGTNNEADFILNKALCGAFISKDEANKFRSVLLTFLGKLYNELGWAMQIHIGAQRNNSTRSFNAVGRDAGFDSISDDNYSLSLSKLLDSMDKEDSLPRTIIYCLNPRNNEMIGTMIGNFQGGGIPGKVQFGSGWWFNDQKDGMERQMIALANLGLLSRFVGMVTDSRSFLSYIRHEYFRRTLCNLIGKWVENGEVPNDLDLLGKMVEDISYNNSEKYFKIELSN